MKNKMKYLLASMATIIMTPIIVNAENATIALEKVDNSNKNVAQYNVVYTPGTETRDSIYLKIDKTNTVENVIYSLSKTDNSAITGSCDSSTLTCTLITTTITEKSTIASLVITNNTTTEQTTRITLGGDLTSEATTISLNAQPTTTTTTTTTTTKVLNTDNSLSSINLSIGTMDQEFNKDITKYTITGIKDTVNSVTVTPNCDNNCTWNITCPTGECSISNSRRVNLQTGANQVAINVTSENGENNKTYILNIYRGEIETSSAYLSSLKIKDTELSPNFESMVNDYTITVGLDVNELDITPVTEDPSANVVIKGNNNLKEGENTVTVTVTSSDGENKQVYTILVTKEEIEEEEETAKEETPVIETTKVEKKKNNTWLIVILSVIGILLIGLTFFLIFRKKKNKNKDKDKKNNNNSNNGTKISLEKEESDIERENTENLHILDETSRQLNDEPKQDVDEALDDLMKTKKLELGDLDF